MLEERGVVLFRYEDRPCSIAARIFGANLFLSPNLSLSGLFLGYTGFHILCCIGICG